MLNFCEVSSVSQQQVREVSKPTDLSARGSHLEEMMSRLEKKMEDFFSKNEKIVKVIRSGNYDRLKSHSSE